MHMVMPVVNQLITMVILMVIGFIIRRRNTIDDNGIRGANVILTKVAVPCMMIVLLQREFSEELLKEFGLASLGALVISLLLLVIFYVVGKFLHMDFPALGLFAGCGAYRNVAFMGQPLVMAMFGDEGLKFCAPMIFVQNILLFSLFSVVFARGCGPKKSARQVIRSICLNSICICSVLGFVFFVTSFSLPEPIFNALDAARVTTSSLSMIIIGALLATANLKNILKDKYIYIYSFFALIVTPIVAKLLLSTFLEGTLLSVLLILISTPAAAAPPAFVADYGNDGQRASEYVFVSTVFSVFTLPLVVMFLC